MTVTDLPAHLTKIPALYFCHVPLSDNLADCR